MSALPIILVVISGEPTKYPLTYCQQCRRPVEIKNAVVWSYIREGRSLLCPACVRDVANGRLAEPEY